MGAHPGDEDPVRKCEKSLTQRRRDAEGWTLWSPCPLWETSFLCGKMSHGGTGDTE
jgi:hypothetical protein